MPRDPLSHTDIESRALVPMDAQPPRAALPGPEDARPLANFVTQLIASNRRMPAYRTACRAEPAEAAQAYAEPAGRAAKRLDRVV